MCHCKRRLQPRQLCITLTQQRQQLNMVRVSTVPTLAAAVVAAADSSCWHVACGRHIHMLLHLQLLLL
jgi:hypothetical protein